MAHMSIRAQRELAIQEQQTDYLISEVIDVMREIDLMDLIRAKCDGDLHELTTMLVNASGQDSRNEPFRQDSYGHEEGKTSPPPTQTATSIPGFASNFVAREENQPQEEKHSAQSALSSVWNVDIRRSPGSDHDIPARSALSTSFDEIDMKTQSTGAAEEDGKYHSKDSRLSSRSHQSAQSVQSNQQAPAEYSGRVTYQVPLEDEYEDADEETHSTGALLAQTSSLQKSSSDQSQVSVKDMTVPPQLQVKKLSFFGRALQGLMGQSSSNISDKYKSEDFNDDFDHDPSADVPGAVHSGGGDIESGEGQADMGDDYKFVRRNSATENAPRAVLRRGSSTNAEIERELTRKKSIRTSQTLANEAMQMFHQRRDSHSARDWLNSAATVAETDNALLVVSGDDIEQQRGRGGELEEKYSGRNGGVSSTVSDATDARIPNRQKLASML